VQNKTFEFVLCNASVIFYSKCGFKEVQLYFSVYLFKWLLDCKTLSSQVLSYGRASTGSSKKMDGIRIRYNLKSTRRIYTFGVLKCSEKYKILTYVN